MLLVVMRLIWYGYTCSLPIAAGREGVFYLLKLFLPAFLAATMGGGGGGTAPCDLNPTQDNLKAYSKIAKYSTKLETLPYCDMYYLLRSVMPV